ncbi:MAG TPA: DUF2867 domain-containing protein [Firmicutes bacterium]|nr:DUF2867 domain-containing protein [Bacillota bacterium]
MKILVTGATGYIGGRLVPRLLAEGHGVRIAVRDPSRIARRWWRDQVEVVTADMLYGDGLEAAVEDVDAAYYLVHSMGVGREYPDYDRRAAQRFCEFARRIPRVIYLGGLLPTSGQVTRHLASRAEVGQLLREELGALELRAGPIIGSGSASFELLRYLVKRLPVILAPRGMHNRVTPIAVRDILSYLICALRHEGGGVIDVGTEPLSFFEMMKTIAEVRGHRRIFLYAPFVGARAAGVSSSLVTPLPRSLTIPIVEGVVHTLLADTRRARELFPEVEPISYRRAVELALGRIARDDVETSWSGALGGGPTYELHDWQGMARERRSIYIDAPPQAVYRSFASLGGDTGWLVWNWAWRWRGRLDKLLGGPGLRRGRRHPTELNPGEAVDFWRVELVRPPSILRLRAEMRLPGKAWLQWEALPEGEGTRLVQNALFEPTGFWGSIYWYLLYPFHRVIFSQLVRAVGRRAEEGQPREGTSQQAQSA